MLHESEEGSDEQKKILNEMSGLAESATSALEEFNVSLLTDILNDAEPGTDVYEEALDLLKSVYKRKLLQDT